MRKWSGKKWLLFIVLTGGLGLIPFLWFLTWGYKDQRYIEGME